VLYGNTATSNGGKVPDEEELKSALAEMESRLFGIARVDTMQQTLSDQDFIPIKS